jgi:curli biogenesis system outer membrane secretion channel CsgG
VRIRGFKAQDQMQDMTWRNTDAAGKLSLIAVTALGGGPRAAVLQSQLFGSLHEEKRLYGLFLSYKRSLVPELSLIIAVLDG